MSTAIDPGDSAESRWVSGPGLYLPASAMKSDPILVYPLIIRGDDDPERKPRPKGGQADRTPHRTLNRTQEEDWFAAILELLSDGRPRTMNAIGVDLIDKTADIIAWTPLGRAVLRLADRGELEMTLEAPIQFRRPDCVREESGGREQ